MELEIEIQYLAEMIDPDYTYFKITLIDCDYYAFESWKKGTIHNSDADQIRSRIIDMDISNAKNESN
ncbi:hypothetical protein KSB_79070 [Ktedonobacter robiniae]|uniref:Uncharacterized protein n=1 Tax=Ktedonobacter robiniae TaxID=2778365 RepID=A0ABQ3V3U1_9CHLR|nr:hypothetical protein KSB_79070 [Ktedonobacter robiniae]